MTISENQNEIMNFFRRKLGMSMNMMGGNYFVDKKTN